MFRYLADYHQYEVHGFENVPVTGPAMIAANHSFAIYDSFLLALPILDRLGRHVHGLADHLIFKLPGLGRVFRETGFVPGTRQAAIDFIKQGNMVGCMPGGMREALRGPEYKYQVDWRGRRGFVWVALKSGAPIVLVASPRGDDIFDVRPNRYTQWALERLHVPFALIRGRGGLPVPKPVKVTQLVSEPLVADVAPDQVTERDVEAHHERVVARMNRLMQDALALG
jgi:1-acyl-sn-glycerol-3-phosphate acyltransferase